MTYNVYPSLFFLLAVSFCHCVTLGETIIIYGQNSGVSPAEDNASRFLAQATMGYDWEEIQTVEKTGPAAWIEQQFAIPPADVVELTDSIRVFVGEEAVEFNGMFGFRSAWWNLVLTEPDLLRQRTAYAYSQIFVVSAAGSDIFEDQAILSSAYYDILNRHAFGNFRDLLGEITRSPSMGMYLSHLNNPRSQPDRNIHPDENYAREIMQLFTIGLYELNLDGTQKLDREGNPIPTYNNADIREYAKVFTGFGPGTRLGEFGIPIDDLAEHLGRHPMRMVDEQHEPGEKRLLRGEIIPAGLTGEQDVDRALDNLFNHPNVGPFIGRKLIQFYTTSNPSPAYVERVARAFHDNGSGVRGDMKAVIRAILLDPEARGAPGDPATFGKLREPLLRYTHFLRAFEVEPASPVILDRMLDWQMETGQVPMYSSSVFNFYLPDFQPNGPIGQAGLVAPVFQIHNSSTSIGYANMVDFWLFGDQPLEIREYDEIPEEELEELAEEDREELEAWMEFLAENDIGYWMDFDDEYELVWDPPALVDRLNRLLAAGQLSESTQAVIERAVSEIEAEEDKLKIAIYLIMIAPEFAVIK